MKNKIFKYIFSVWGLVVANLLSVIINAPDFISGTGDINPVVIFATTIYMLHLLVYALFNRQNKTLILWSIITLITASISVIVSENHLMMDWMIPFVFIFISPFYALKWFVLGSYTYSYFIIITFSLLILLINLIDIKTGNKEIKRAKAFNYTVAAIFSALLICALLIFFRFKITGHFIHIGMDKSIPYINYHTINIL